MTLLGGMLAFLSFFYCHHGLTMTMTYALCVGFMSYKSGIPQLRSDIHAMYNVLNMMPVVYSWYSMICCRRYMTEPS